MKLLLLVLCYDPQHWHRHWNGLASSYHCLQNDPTLTNPDNTGPWQSMWTHLHPAVCHPIQLTLQGGQQWVSAVHPTHIVQEGVERREDGKDTRCLTRQTLQCLRQDDGPEVDIEILQEADTNDITGGPCIRDHTRPLHVAPHQALAFHTTPGPCISHYTGPLHFTRHQALAFHTTPGPCISHDTRPLHSILQLALAFHTTPGPCISHYTRPLHSILQLALAFHTTPGPCISYYTRPLHSILQLALAFHTTPGPCISHYTRPLHFTRHQALAFHTTTGPCISHHTRPLHFTLR